MIKKFIVFLFIAIGFTNAQTIIIDDFEDGLGHFNLHTTYSGSSHGILSTTPVLDATILPVSGAQSLKIELVDNAADTVDWFVRFLSGTGTPGNNVVLGDTGYVGFWIRANRPYVSVQFILDDLNASGTGVGTNELSLPLQVMGGENWYLYTWDMADTNNWSAFIASGNGMIQDPVTIDAIVFTAPNALAHNDTATIWLDKVSFNPTAPLPVELTSFIASADVDVVTLKWITASELNNKNFEIERKFESGNWGTIGTLEGRGTTQEITGYTFSDKVNEVGHYSYRLKQNDFSGAYEYSKVVEVQVIGVTGSYSLMQNYPNPFNPNTKISYYLPEKGLVNLSVFNMLGQKVEEIFSGVQESGEYSVNFDGSKLNSGVYVYSLQVDGKTLTNKMTLLK